MIKVFLRMFLCDESLPPPPLKSRSIPRALISDRIQKKSGGTNISITIRLFLTEIQPIENPMVLLSHFVVCGTSSCQTFRMKSTVEVVVEIHCLWVRKFRFHRVLSE